MSILLVGDRDGGHRQAVEVGIEAGRGTGDLPDDIAAGRLRVLRAMAVTVWGTFQSLASKTSVEGESRPCVGSELVRLIVTGLAGIAVNATLNVVVPPSPLVCKEVWSTVMAGVFVTW